MIRTFFIYFHAYFIELMRSRVMTQVLLVSVALYSFLLLSVTGSREEFILEWVFGYPNLENEIPLIVGGDMKLMLEGSNINYVRDLDSVRVIVMGTVPLSMHRGGLMLEILKGYGFNEVRIHHDDDFVRLLSALVIDSNGRYYYDYEVLMNYLDNRYRGYYSNGERDGYLTIGVFGDYAFGYTSTGMKVLGYNSYKNLLIYNGEDDDDDLFKSTLRHEILHSFGMMHCNNSKCILYPHMVGFGRRFNGGLDYSDKHELCDKHLEYYCMMFGCVTEGIEYDNNGW
jgi:hypothetical protein